MKESVGKFLFDLIYTSADGNINSLFNLILRFDNLIRYFAKNDEDLKQELIIYLYYKIRKFEIRL